MSPSFSVAALDVGSLAKLGWWLDSERQAGGGTDIDSLVATVVSELDQGEPVALGFEAPTFVPLPALSGELCKQRQGERGRPWSAGAGTAALAIGVQQATFVLGQIGQHTKRPIRAGTNPDDFGRSTDLLVWEAFVTGKAKNPDADNPHVDDARLAVEEFSREWPRAPFRRTSRTPV